MKNDAQWISNFEIVSLELRVELWLKYMPCIVNFEFIIKIITLGRGGSIAKAD